MAKESQHHKMRLDNDMNAVERNSAIRSEVYWSEFDFIVDLVN